MRDVLTWTLWIGGWLVCASWLYHAVRILVHTRSKPRLSSVPPLPEHVPPPAVCVIVPACNEADSIEACLRSLQAQTYPRLSIIAVNDRSSDETGAIMDRVAAEDPRIEVVHVKALPDGWLGKNHANWLAAEQPSARDSEYLLFTDGDIIFEPDCVSRGIHWMQQRDLGHLSLLPHIIPAGYMERAMCYFFGLCYVLKCRTWNVGNPRRPGAFTGVGAFNMVLRSAYDQVGGHEPLRLEVIDDYKLGKLMKHAGNRCDLLDSANGISVRWHVGLRGVVRGLEKNAFAGCDFSIARAVLTLAALFVMFIFPVFGIFIAPGWSRLAWAGALGAQMALVAWFAIRSKASPWLAVAAPLCATALLWAILRGSVLALARGGIRWRGTFYPLRQLKQGRI